MVFCDFVFLYEMSAEAIVRMDGIGMGNGFKRAIEKEEIRRRPFVGDEDRNGSF